MRSQMNLKKGHAMDEEKVRLADHLHQELKEKFYSVSNAALNKGIPYERLKQAIRRNCFNEADLHILCPDQSVAELSAKFEFRLARGYESLGPRSREPLPSLPMVVTMSLDEEDILFINQNKAVADRVARAIREECRKLRKFFEGAT